MRLVPAGNRSAAPSISRLCTPVPIADSVQATGTGGNTGAASAQTSAATSVPAPSSIRPTRVVSGVRDVARLDASHATPAANAADSRGEAPISTAAAGTSATNKTDEQ